jgi:DNA-binding IclR family transcriptional regulator
MATILETLATAPMVASEIATTLGISTQKASALCKLLANEGKVAVSEVKVKNKGAVKQYALVTNEGE